MGYKDKQLLKDEAGNPIAQYFNEELDRFEALLGENGATRVIAYNPDGSPLTLELEPVIEKLGQLAGSVLDETTRKENEVKRVEQYELVEEKLASGEFVGPQGDSIEYNWDGYSLGIRVEGGTSYEYQNLRGEKGEQGPVGSIDNLTSGLIEEALGYVPVNKTELPSKTSDLTNDSGYITEEEVPEVDISGKVDKVTGKGLSTNDYDNLAVVEVAKVKDKVDKVPGKGLSTNDFTTPLKSKLDGISAGAEKNQSITHLMPKKNGVLENYTEKLNTVTAEIDLSLGNVFYRNATANTTFSISNAKTGGHSFTLVIDMATVRTLTFPASVKWQDDEVPDLTEANKTYVLTFMTIDGGTTWLGMFGGVF